MSSESDIADWNRIASEYCEKIEEGGGRREISEPLLERIGKTRGMSVLDLGCGHGWLCNELEKRGSNVIGVDGSDEMIDWARAQFPHLDFHVFDLAHGLPELDCEFDIVVANMVVMDLHRIDRTFSALYQILKPSGRFLMTLPHPCFFNQKSHEDDSGRWFKKVTGYLEPEIWRIDSFGGHNHYHRSLSTYINALSEAGLYVSWIHEPPHRSNSEGIRRKFLKTIPVFLLIEAVKA